MNNDNESIARQRGFHSSPKKKLSFRSKDNIENVRRGLKDAKDISARNLMAKLDCDDGKDQSDSTVEEVVMIEEVTEEVEDESVEYIEEIVDSDDDDSYLEALPPPIEIPRALQVKDDEDEEADRNTSDDGSDDDSDDVDSDDDKRKVTPPTKVAPVVQKPVEAIAAVHEKTEPPAKVSDAPMAETSATAQSFEAMSESNNENDATEKEDEICEMKESEHTFIKSVRPSAMRGMSYAEEETSSTVKALEMKPSVSENDEVESSLAWKKPDWTKNTKLRPTGKSAKENLAKPITILPHLKHGAEDGAANISTPRTPTAASKPRMKQAPKTPTPFSHNSPTEERVCPKSAPSRPNAAISMGNDDVPKIEWTKPDWTRKKILRDTSKGQKILSGQEISRPIGGIRPVQD